MDEKGLNKSIKVKIIAVTALLLLMGVFGVSYAYFTVQVTGNENASSIDMTAAKLSLIYTDVQIIMGEHEQPGWTDTKVLTVENNGTDTVSYALKWRELVNTIINDELVISATCTSTSGTCPNIPETIVPNAPTEVTNVYLYGPVTIPVGAKHTYTLTVLFKETGSNQNYNQNKYFNGTINVDVDSVNYSDDWEKTYTVTFDANGGSTPVSSKTVSVGLPYGELPTPTRAGYTFKGWNGKNKLNYGDISTAMSSTGITANNDGYISDSSPTSDTRGWNYSYNSGWRTYLTVGSYTVSLSFSTQSTTGDNRIVIKNASETAFVNTSIANKSIAYATFSLSASETINIVAKGYDGVYRIQIEEGTEATAWEPYYIKPDTKVTQKHNHTLTAIWE